MERTKVVIIGSEDQLAEYLLTHKLIGRRPDSFDALRMQGVAFISESAAGDASDAGKASDAGAADEVVLNFTNGPIADPVPTNRICWDAYEPVEIYGDGSCLNNGKPNASAGFGCAVYGGVYAGKNLYGPVEPGEYVFIDQRDPLKGFVCDRSKFAQPTNNRGEYLAGCWAFLMLARSRALGPRTFISDSRLFCLTILQWLAKWKREGTVESHANSDLIMIADTLYATTSITIRKVNAAHDRPRPSADASADDLAMWYGNTEADRLANAGRLVAKVIIEQRNEHCKEHCKEQRK